MGTQKQLTTARKIQLFGRLSLVVGLSAAAYLIFFVPADIGQSNSSVLQTDGDEQLVSHSSREISPSRMPGVGTMPIQQLKVGDRVLAHNPEVREAERQAWSEPEWDDWLHLSLQMPLPGKEDSDEETKILNIEILRPESWFQEQVNYVIDDLEPDTQSTQPPFPLAEEGFSTLVSHSPGSSELATPNSPLSSVPLSPLRPVFRNIAITSAILSTEGIDLVGLTVEMDLPEMGAVGTAIVTDIKSCPPVRGDRGQVVTATFAHPPTSEVLDVVFEGESTAIGVTDNHPFWSVNDQRFVAIGDLSVGAKVQTYQGETKRIASKLPRPGPQTVYNLEVYGEHVYFVGEQGILVHNMYDGHSPAYLAKDAAFQRYRTRQLSRGNTPLGKQAWAKQSGYDAGIARHNANLKSIAVAGRRDPRHHLFPQEGALRVRFENQGININRYTIELPHDVHNRIHKGAGGGLWNDEWHRFFRQNPNADVTDIFRQVGRMIYDFEIDGRIVVPYR